MSSENSLGVEIQRIRDRLRAMRTEREAAMHELAESREQAEASRQTRSEGDTPVLPAPPPAPSDSKILFAP